jgi:Raf kinase inhibitor-like YbhB/YbcL family protein
VRCVALLIGALMVSGCLGGGLEEVEQMGGLKLASPAFADGQAIPAKHTCDGADVSPPLRVSGVPADAKSLALVVDDPDAPMGVWVHWVVWDIPPDTSEIPEDSTPGIEGVTDFKSNGWGGPCPPGGTHRYAFKLYALDRRLGLALNGGKSDLLKAMEGHILAQTQLTGTYRRA